MDRLKVVWLGMLCWSCVSAGSAAETIVIVDQRQPRASIVVPSEAAEQTKQAANLLAEYVKRSSGAELPIRSESEPAATRQPVTIHVGQDTYVKGLGLGIEKLDDDGFVIRGVDQSHVVVAGPTPFGDEYGVCEFLERYVGVRWLLPGPEGDDVPACKTIAVPTEEVREEPAFFSRLFSGLRGSAQTTWARRLRMHGRVSFHHNLLRLLPPETYTKTHPEFFPVKKGKRYLPPDSHAHGWQPCFSAEGIDREAAEQICRYFDEHPQVPSYSLGVNDSSGHCECEKCQSQDTGEKNFVGRRDVSDRYYGWCNRVVEQVLKKHPDKFFGCLAYSEVAQPPARIKLNPRIIPYMTYDRMKWIDPELRADGERMTKLWREKSPVVGWYDYIYGSHYCVPRVWFHQMADYYRFGHANGVRALYAEAYPNWGEGPKLYVSLKLQWDPHQDVDLLLKDWYVRAVGPDAADDLAAYYALWEDFWTRRILESKWFTKGGQYLRFTDPSYLADVTEKDVTTSRTLLEQVVQKAKTPAQQARARLLLAAFEYYEASAVAYRGNRLSGELLVQTEAEALDSLSQGERCLRMAKKRQQVLMKEYPKYPALLHGIDFNRRPLLRGDDWGGGLLWNVFDWATKSDKVRGRLRELSASSCETVRLQAETMLQMVDGKSSPVSQNPSFEDPQGRWPKAWSPWIKWGIGKKTASPKAARTGALGVLCTGMKRGGPHQTVAVTPGRYAAVAFVRVPQDPKGSATVSVQMTPLGEKGQNLPTLAGTVRAKAGDWRAIAIAGEIPAKVKGESVSKVRLIVLIDGFEPGEEVHIDDCMMLKLK